MDVRSGVTDLRKICRRPTVKTSKNYHHKKQTYMTQSAVNTANEKMPIPRDQVKRTMNEFW